MKRSADADDNNTDHDNNNKLVCGLEGGATKTSFLIVDAIDGKTIAKGEKSVCTNQYLVGIEKCCESIISLIADNQYNLNYNSNNYMFACIVLSLSGVCNKDDEVKIENELRRQMPFLSEHYIVCDDMEASIRTSPGNGGILVIAGTGQNTCFYSPDQSGFKHKAGGWGHMIDEDGCAYYIANLAIRSIVRLEENVDLSWLPSSSSSISHEILKKRLLSHFKIQNVGLDGLLDIHYRHFSKDVIASFATEVIDAWLIDHDQLAKEIIDQAGRSLALLISAHLPFIITKYKMKEVNVVCVGSVWKSYEIFKDALIATLKERIDRYRHDSVIKFNFKQLTSTSTFGAVRMALTYLSSSSSSSSTKIPTTLFSPSNNWGVEGLIDIFSIQS